jgi:hypothetical protein
MKKQVWLWLLNLMAFGAMAQSGGVKGRIIDQSGEALPFASIYVKNTRLGTASNAQGFYELRLPEGKYDVVFQYMTYQTVEKSIEVGSGFAEINIIMVPQVFVLKEVEVRSRKEDPAYTIMRKAIAMSKVHKMQVNEYQARVYLKGTGRILDIPRLLEGKLKKEGITKDQTYLSETISEVSFKQPNKYDKKVIALRSSSIEPDGVEPMDYIQASFYDPEIGQIVSPLASSAFAYYKFALESTFSDQGYEVNKIRVTPRSRGDNVWEGHIYIVEDRWCIHSLDLKTEKLGIKIGVQQTYSPIEDVFMPTNHRFNVRGRYLGFEGEFKYVASVSDYKLVLNPDFIPEVKLIDEKLEKEKAVVVNKQNKDTESLAEALAEGKELTRKNLRKFLKEQEKQELAEARKSTAKGEVAEVELVVNESTKIDSLAKKRGQDSLYWVEFRTIPLADYEILSYQKRDSLIKVDSVKKSREVRDSASNTVTKTKSKFSPTDLLFGGSYKLSKRATLTFTSLASEINYNTVEGFAGDIGLTYRLAMKNKSLRVGGVARYALAREALSGRGNIAFTYNAKKQGILQIDGGRYIQQMSTEYPIPVVLNTISSLMFERNWMKIYERDYLRLRWSEQISSRLETRASLEIAKRYPLQNNTDYKIIDWESREFTSNIAENLEVSETAFPVHNAYTFQADLIYKPTLRYGMRNGKRYQITDNSPVFNLSYRKGMGDTDFDFLSLGVQHETRVGIRSTIGYALSGGAFLNQNTVYFPDFKHFNGNRMFVQFADPVSSFRLLEYYRFSTPDKYLEGHAYVRFRKLLLTQFIYLRSFGWKENIFVNHLTTPNNQYSEVGYALDGILRLFRVEAIAAFENGRYHSWGIRVGITTTFGLKINTD